MSKKEQLDRTITVQHILNILNEAVEIDKQAMVNLINNRVRCADGFLGHPTIQVGYFPKDGSAPEKGSPNVKTDEDHLVLGFIGLLNGLAGKQGDTTGIICADFDDDGNLLKFRLTEYEDE